MRVVLDSSAILAVGLNEPDADIYEQALEGLVRPVISALTLFEMRTVLAFRKGPAVLATMEKALARARTEIVAFDEARSDGAFAAYRRFGKGTGHPARLNLVDCAGYALAAETGLPLLFKGADFHHTDVTPALPLLVPDAGDRM